MHLVRTYTSNNSTINIIRPIETVNDFLRAARGPVQDLEFQALEKIEKVRSHAPATNFVRRDLAARRRHN